jgi:hypothetical protein
MAQIAASPPTVPLASYPVDEQPDERSDAIVACLRDRLLVASCRARSAPVRRDDEISVAAAKQEPRPRKRYRLAWRGDPLRSLVVAVVAVMIVAAGAVLFGRIS